MQALSFPAGTPSPFGTAAAAALSDDMRRHIDDLWRFKVMFQAQFGERVALAELAGDGGLRCRCFALALQAGMGELPHLAMKLQTHSPAAH